MNVLKKELVKVQSRVVGDLQKIHNAAVERDTYVD